MREAYPTLMSNGSVDRQAESVLNGKKEVVKNEIDLKPQSIKAVCRMSETDFQNLVQ